MADYILLLLSVLVTGFIGWNILYLISRREGFAGLFLFERIGLSYLFGLGIITIQMFVMGLFRMEFTRFNILIPWVGIALLALLRLIMRPVPMRVRFRRMSLRLRRRLRPGGGAFEKLTLSETILICMIVAQTLYNFFQALIKPIEAYDSVAIYGLKSKMIYLAGGITGGFFDKLSLFFQGSHPDYPLFVPLSEVWVYAFLGSFNDILVKAIFPLFYLSFILVFYSILKRITKSRVISLLFTFALASIKQFSDYSTIGSADLELGIYFGIGLFYLYLWMKKRENAHFLNISLASSVLCLWTKNEGALLAAAILLALLFYIATHIGKIEKGDILRLFAYVLVLLIAAGSWNAFTNSRGLENENFNLSMINIQSFTGNLNKIPAVMYEYQKHLFGFKKWNIIWILFVLVLLKEFKAAFSGNVKYITVIFFLLGLGYGLVYIFSAVDIKFFLSTTGSRFLLHVLPVTLFWMCIVMHKQKLIEG